MDLFQSVDFKSSAGLDLKWKIECDAISDDEWKCIATMIMERTRPFKNVVGIPRGGIKLAQELDKYSTGYYRDPVCIVDDVLTTGNSMKKCREEIEKNRLNDEETKVVEPKIKYDPMLSGPIGWVVFARGECPRWINPLFQTFISTLNHATSIGALSYHGRGKENLDALSYRNETPKPY